jgi:hypothetical protein
MACIACQSEVTVVHLCRGQQAAYYHAFIAAWLCGRPGVSQNIACKQIQQQPAVPSHFLCAVYAACVVQVCCCPAGWLTPTGANATQHSSAWHRYEGVCVFGEGDTGLHVPKEQDCLTHSTSSPGRWYRWCPSVVPLHWCAWGVIPVWQHHDAGSTGSQYILMCTMTADAAKPFLWCAILLTT